MDAADESEDFDGEEVEEGKRPFGLTLRQERFARLYFQHGIGCLAAEQAGYKVGAGLSVTASRLTRHPKVQLFISMLSRNAAETSDKVLSSEQVLARLSHEALTAKSDSSRVAALGKLAEHHGLLIQRHLDMTERPSADVIADLKRTFLDLAEDPAVRDGLERIFAKIVGEEGPRGGNLH